MQIVEFTEDFKKFKTGMRMRLEDPSHFRKDDNSWFENDLDCVLVTNSKGSYYVPKKVLRVVTKEDKPRLLRRVYTDKEKEFLLKKSKGRCACCGKKLDLESLTVEHVIPLALGGGNVEDNLVVLCFDCNTNKADTIKGIKYYKYLSEGSRKVLKNYMGLFTATNTRVHKCDLVITGVDEITLVSGKVFCYSIYSGKKPSTVFHSYTRDIKVAWYSDLDNLYETFKDSSYFESKEDCKEYLSNFFSNGKIYMLCNDDSVKAIFTISIENVGGNSVFYFHDILYCNKVPLGDRVSCLSSVIRWLSLRLRVNICQAQAYTNLGYTDFSEEIKKSCIKLYDYDFDSIPLAIGIGCNKCSTEFEAIVDSGVLVEDDTYLSQCHGSVFLVINPKLPNGNFSLRDKDVIRKCGKLIDIQSKLEDYTLIINKHC